MHLPHITPTQKTILLLIYRFRFLNRLHIQTLLNNPDLKNINTWLKDLYEKQYLRRIVNTNETVNTMPHIYYIGINGIRYLKTEESCHKEYITRLYKEHKIKEPFINRCFLIADIYLQLLEKYKDTFTFYTQSDFTPKGLIRDLLPDFTYKKENEDFFVIGQLFYDYMIKKAIESKIDNYLSFFTSNKWLKNEKPPKILFICANDKMEKHVLRYIKKQLDIEDKQNLTIRITTREQIKADDIEGNIWKKVDRID